MINWIGAGFILLYTASLAEYERIDAEPDNDTDYLELIYSILGTN